jgi:hypothetical protein
MHVCTAGGSSLLPYFLGETELLVISEKKIRHAFCLTSKVRRLGCFLLGATLNLFLGLIRPSFVRC